MSESEGLHEQLVLGLDCGGSKTTALLGNLSGEIIGCGGAAGANYQTMPEETIRTNLRQAVKAAFASANLQPGRVSWLHMGMAGIDRPGESTIIENWLREESLAAGQSVGNDGPLLLWAGTPEGWGIGVISGTGSIVIGRNQAGKTARAGGWGYILGDEGSGYAIGKAALQTIARAADGINPPTLLSDLILKFWGLKNPQELIPKVYRQIKGRDEIAALAALVQKAAAQKDPAAQEILSSAAVDLSKTIAAAHRKLGLPQKTPAAFGGGVLNHFPGIVAGVQEALHKEGIDLSPLQLVHEPARGALRLACIKARGA